VSYEIGKAALNLQWTPRVARTEYVDNWEIVRHFTGKDPCHYPEAWREFNDAIHLDYLWSTHDGPVPWEQRGRTTDMGHAVYMEDGSDYRRAKTSPFLDVEEVLAFNAVEEYGLVPSSDELVRCYEQWYQSAQAANDQVVSGGYYRTLVSGAIAAFGWERLLEAAGTDPERFGEKALGSIFELSMHHYRAWAQTSIEFFMCHDDMVWTQGPFLRPDFYRQYIFPRYRELWGVLREAGKKVLFTSDGTFDMFLDDLIAAGADGFCFEPSNDLELLAEKCGQTHVLMGGADCRTLSFGTKEDIEQELRWVFGLAKPCPGFVFATGNHFPANIPLENALHYFALIEELGTRE
jgi:hypothetical protein